MSWIERDRALHREIKTKDFVSAYDLVSALVAPAEAMNHHPDIELGWGYVRIHLTTHDAGGVTGKDRKLAAEIDAVVAALDKRIHEQHE